MKSVLQNTGVALVLLSAIGLATTATASPLIPEVWQARVKAGPLEDQRKHVQWVRDQDGDFVDDAFNDLSPGDKARVIVQLSDCMPPEDLVTKFSAFGDVVHTGVIVAYVVIDNVPQELLDDLANDPMVAAVERPREIQLFHDTSTRTIRKRASNTFSPNTFADAFPGVDGTGVNIAVVDTGVDDAVHAGFAGKFVSGFNACTNTAGNPNDDLPGPIVDTGADGICNTAAAGDDVQAVAVGGMPANLACVGIGPNGVLNSVPLGDDFVGQINYGGGHFSAQVVATGADGICNTPAAADDYQVAPVGSPLPNATCIQPGPNGMIDTAPAGDDVFGEVHHGTHVAGSALGLGVGPGCRNADDGSAPNDCAGVAPGAGLVDVKVFANGCVTDESLLVQALDWLWQDGNTHVVNMSLGTNTQDDGTDTISNVINALVANDIVVVVAAGNSIGNCLGAVQASSLAITVANDNDQGTINRNDDQFAFSSTFGPRVDFNPANPDAGMLKPDVAAPGTDIVSVLGETGNTADGYHALTGTSMASPHVAGSAALLIDMRPDVPPGAIKDILKRTAFQTPQHVAAGASFPAVDAVYNVNWGWGLIDLYTAGTQLDAGVADVSFTDCTGPHPDYPTSRRCLLSGGKPSYANNVDIQLATDPPVQEVANTITVSVENRSGIAAQNVVVCVGVKDFGVGVQEFYDVGCKEIGNIGPGAGGLVQIPWTPTASSHQCIQASIDYGLDTDFTNNLTQRNVSPVPGASPSKASFRVENPLQEQAEIILQMKLDEQAQKNLESVRVTGVPLDQPILLGPADCPLLGEVQFFPIDQLPVGATGRVEIAATARSRSHPDGIELSGVVFDYQVVDPGLRHAFSCVRHGPAGMIKLPLELDGDQPPTSDPRQDVAMVKVRFNVPMQPPQGVPLADTVQITAVGGSTVPPFQASFVDDGGDAGQELMITFERPLPNKERYRFDFGRLVDLDGDKLTGDPDFELVVLEGDSNNTRTVSITDLVDVRGGFGTSHEDPAWSPRRDVSPTGTISIADLIRVRANFGAEVP